MQKEKKYNWKDSNVQLIGSSEDRNVKKSSADTETAWNEAKKCGVPAIFVWRIEKFKVKPWPKESYGEFYEGDSYIILNIYKHENELLFDVHFWIGKYSSQDEYGTAAYKTVELDTLLDDKPVQHREVQHYESDLFKSYFKDIVYLKGGCESGFRHVTTKEYKPRLLHVRGEKKNIIISEVSMSRQNIHSDDVFILDTGTNLYQWIGTGANANERFRSGQFVQQLNADRQGKAKLEVLDEGETPANHEFYTLLSDQAIDTVDGKDDKSEHKLELRERQLFKISDATGSLKFEKVASGNIKRSSIVEDDVFIVDNGEVLYVYVGQGASDNEKKNALVYAHNYLKETEYPQVPVTVVNQKVKGINATHFENLFT